MITSEQIAEIVRILSDSCNPEKIILFGSYAHGTAHSESDLDLAVIKKTELPYFQRPVELLKALRAGRRRWFFPMDIVVYTPEEFKQHQNNQYHLIHEIALTGKVIYERQRSPKLVAKSGS
jgi:uncharacterized protein